MTSRHVFDKLNLPLTGRLSHLRRDSVYNGQRVRAERLGAFYGVIGADPSELFRKYLCFFSQLSAKIGRDSPCFLD